MNFRFEDSISERSLSSKLSTEDGLRTRRSRSIVGSVLGSIQRGFEKVSKRIRSFKKLLGRNQLNDLPIKQLGHEKTILDPRGPFLQKWNRVFVIACMISLSLDPLFFYIPVIDSNKKCLSLDRSLGITACVLRSFTDIFYILHILFQFRTGFISPSSRVFGRGELTKDPYAIAKRYLRSYFIIDILAILPLPQLVILVIIPRHEGPVAQLTNELLKAVILTQYFPRVIRINPLVKEVTRTLSLSVVTAWRLAVGNLFRFMLASHVVGAFWYLFAIERQDSCWRKACKNQTCIDELLLYCEKEANNGRFSLPDNSCPLLEPSGIKNSTDFDFGIFLDALKSGMVETRDFPKKFFYCIWWGLRNLSSLGQNLKTSDFVWEILFAIFIFIIGLVLFAFLIGNMQKYLQSRTVRVEEMMVKRRDAEQWMADRMLPESLRQRIRRYEQYKWQETSGVDENSLIPKLPKDIRRDLKRHLYWSSLRRVPLFGEMDDQLLDAMCDHLKPVLYTKDSVIVREGDPVDEMLFVVGGNLLIETTNWGRTGFLNSINLTAGDFCGEELLPWALDLNSSSILPTSTSTARAVTDVEAFALMPDGLKPVASQFRRQSKQFHHTFRFYSRQWRTWGACFIQAAWRRHSRRKIEKSLHEEEDRLKNALANEVGASPSLGATFYASKFAANVLGALHRNQPQNTKLSPRLPPLLPQKPWEPDFTAQDH